MKPPVRRNVGTDVPTILAFVAEAAHHGYPTIALAADAADALIVHFGAPTSMATTVIREEYLPDGMALALPPGTSNLWSAAPTFEVSDV